MANTTKKITDEQVEEQVQAKEAVNVLDLLLGSDIGEIKLPTKEMEITRLSEVFGSPFIITISALSPDKYEEVQDMAVSINGKDADIEMAVKIMYEKEISEADDKIAKINELKKAYTELQSSAIAAAKRGYIDDIIEPDASRKRLIAAFEMLYTKREDRPYKKHGTV